MDNLVPISSANLAIMPTQQIVEYFLNNQESAGTSRTYGSTIRAFFSWSDGKNYRDISPFDALDYDAYLKANKAESTVQTHISTLKKFFQFALECGMIAKNPFALVKQKSAPNRAAEKFLTTKEVEKLLAALKAAGEREYILGLLLASTGMRISEAKNLSWCDFIEMPDGSISVNLLRKGNERQLLPIRQDVWEAVQGFMNRPLNQFDKSPLFLNPSKKRASDVSLRTWIEEAAKKAGITKNVTPHVLRHSFATTALDQGADIRDVSWYLNHKNISTTQIYAHPTNKRVSEFIQLPNRET